MERKIGEVLEYNGEWYQCLKSPDGSCKHCDMDFEKCPIPIKECTESDRSDNSYVIFKKLEKVGEPYAYTSTADKIYNVLMQQYKVNYDEILPFVIGHFFILNPRTNIIAIEIKQTKKDMEEKKLNLKPFDIQKAREGKSVCTRDGRKARIICFDREYLYEGRDYSIVALVSDSFGESVHYYFYNGKVDFDGQFDDDLMMLPEKKEGWVNVMEGTAGKIYVGNNIYRTEDEAKEGASRFTSRLIASVPIEWED